MLEDQDLLSTEIVEALRFNEIGVQRHLDEVVGINVNTRLGADEPFAGRHGVVNAQHRLAAGRQHAAISSR